MVLDLCHQSKPFKIVKWLFLSFLSYKTQTTLLTHHPNFWLLLVQNIFKFALDITTKTAWGFDWQLSFWYQHTIQELSAKLL